MICTLLVGWMMQGVYVDGKPGWYLIKFDELPVAIWVEKKKCEKAD